MSKVERLLNLTMALLGTGRPLTAAELRERVPGYPEAEASFRRAFERDKEALREMGIPLTLTEVPYSDPPVEGYRIAEDDYYLRDPGLEPDELAALHLAASAARLDTGDGREALWKLGGSVAGADDAEPADPTMEGLVELPNDANLGPLFSAAVDRRSVELTYHGRRRRIDPYRLDFRRGHWYLRGYDHSRGGERSFRVDRIEGEVTPGGPGTFERPATAGAPGAPAEPWRFGEDEPVTARLLVDADHARWVRRHLAPGAGSERTGAVRLEERPDGSVVVDVAVINWPAFRSFVLTFLEHAEVLAPAELRADLVAWLERVAATPAPVAGGGTIAGTGTGSGAGAPAEAGT